jgi:alkanesulfonate monooxygenase SsuD/methylene tetrahydromethanopterin reductase-like flavin-dependent oxidoreductase (luciferase family)
VLAEIALRTARIRVASGVLSVWGRTPATLAMTAATLHQICGGRYVLGLGASTKALAEGFHDSPFKHPAGKLRDAVTEVRALLSGLPAQLHHAPGARPVRLGQPPAPEAPIWVAALGPRATRVAAELGDGWMPALVARDRLPALAAQLSWLRETTTPHAPALTVAAGPITAVDEDADAARDIVTACIAWYLRAMGDVYARSVSGQGYATEVRAILAANPRPSPRRGSVPPTPGSSWINSRPTELAIRFTSSSSPGTRPPTSSRSSCLLGMSWRNIEATLLAAAPALAPGCGPAEGRTRETRARCVSP